MDLLDLAKKAGLVEEEKPHDWNSALEALKKNPGDKAQRLYEKLRKRYNLDKS